MSRSDSAMLEVSIGTKERHTMKVRPLYTRVLVRRVEPKKNEVNGAIIIPEMAREKSMEAKIIAVGGGKRTEPARGSHFR